MSNTELFDLLGQIDDKFYEEVLGGDSEKAVKFNTAKKPFSVKRLVLPIAACLVLAVGAGAAVKYFKDGRTASLESIGTAEAALCEELYIEQFEAAEFSVKSRIIDLNCDGTDEVIVTSSSGEYAPLIYSRTKNGMENTGGLEETSFGTKLTDPEQLLYYNADGEQYWYYSYKCYNGEEGDEDNILVHAVARINYDGMKYFTDFPLGYGSLDAWGSGRVYARNLRFSLNELPFNGYVVEPPYDKITADDFIVLWKKYTDMPPISNFAYEDKYPPLDISIIPTIENPGDPNEMKKAVSATLSVIKDYGDQKLCLVGSGIFRYDGGFRAAVLMLGLVKNDHLTVSGGGVSDSGYYKLDLEKPDSYVRVCELSGADIAVLSYFTDGSSERQSCFFRIDSEGALPLLCKNESSSELREIAGFSDDITVFSNSIVDNENNIEYCFHPETFSNGVYQIPNFTTRHSVTAKVARSVNFLYGGSKPAEREDYELWKSVIGSGRIARLEVLSNIMMNTNIKYDLPPEAASAIVNILYNADLKPYNNEMPSENPLTGGGGEGFPDSAIITAFDEENNVLFDVSFDGTWFEAQYEDRGLTYYFNAADSGLKELNYYIPEQRYAAAEILSSKRIGEYMIKMIVKPYDGYAQIVTEHNGAISLGGAAWLSSLSELDMSVIDSYIVPFKTKDVTGFAVYESLDENAPDYKQARLYTVSGTSATALMYENAFAPSSSGSVVYLGSDPKISYDDNSIITDSGERITIDSSKRLFRVTAP